MAVGSTECFLCPELKTQKCLDCNIIHYCKLHQQHHKIGEGGSCSPIRLTGHGAEDRGLQAAWDIPKGSTILIHKPAVLGPCVRSSSVQCLSCFKILDTKYTCTKCLLPVCNKVCERGSLHIAECSILKKIRETLKNKNNGLKIYKENLDNVLSAITTIRLYSLKWRDPGTWDLVSMLINHQVSEILWTPIQEAINTVLVKDDRFDVCEMERVFGIQSTNGANVHLPPGFGRGLGVYPIFAFMNHSCRCNTESLESKTDHLLVVQAKFDIKAGEAITTSYLRPDQGTFARRQFLYNKWKFWCECHRCSDPSELGAFSAGILCNSNSCDGVLLPINPLEESSDWSCDLCQTISSWSQISDLLQQAVQIVEKCENNPDSLETILFELSKILFHRHFMFIQVETRLFQLQMERYKRGLLNLNRPVLDRLVQMGLHLLEQMELTDPGENSLKRSIIEKLVAFRVERACQDFKAGAVKKEYLQNLLVLRKNTMTNK